MTRDTPDAPRFDEDFQERLQQLILWRRDVRRFKADPVEPALIDRLIGLASLAPSVGNNQPWRFVKVDDEGRRAAVRRDFEDCNSQALADHAGERARLYASLKLAGLERAPVQLAVFADSETDLGHGLGSKTMPETLSYSVVSAVNTLWLAARAHGIGMGWVSIVRPERVKAILEVPSSWALIAYLCICYPVVVHLDPDLDRLGWQMRVRSRVIRR